MSSVFFEARVTAADLRSQKGWSCIRDRKYELSTKQSYIRLQKRSAYPNTFLIQDGDTYLFGYASQETIAYINSIGEPISHAQLLSDLEREFFLVKIDTKKGSVRIMRDVICTMPLFVYMDDQQLVFGNEYASIMKHIPKQAVSAENALKHLLSLDVPNSKIIQGTFYLDQTEELCYDGLKQEVKEAELTGIANLPDYEDETPFLFKRILEEHLDSFWQSRLQGQKIGFELSGGLDSSMVAGYYASQGIQDIRTYSIGFWGKDLDTQKEKIQALTQRFKIANQLMPIRLPEHLLLSRFCRSGELESFVDRDMYQEVFEDFVAGLSEQSIDVIVTGVGGNELYAIHKTEESPTYRKPHSEHVRRFNMPTGISEEARAKLGDELLGPVERRKPYVAASVSQTNMMLFNTYIRKGIWPVSPYASPKLLYFMRHIPTKYLYKRRIAQAYLAARSFPSVVYNRKNNESYGSFFEQCIYHELDDTWAECLRDSVLVDRGFVTVEDAQYNYNHRDQTLFYGLWAFKFMELEIFLRQDTVTLDSISKQKSGA